MWWCSIVGQSRQMQRHRAAGSGRRAGQRQLYCQSLLLYCVEAARSSSQAVVAAKPPVIISISKSSCMGPGHSEIIRHKWKIPAKWWDRWWFCRSVPSVIVACLNGGSTRAHRTRYQAPDLPVQ